MVQSYLYDERSASLHNRIFCLIGLLHWGVVDMMSKTASWFLTPLMDTHLSTREGQVVIKTSIILLPLEGIFTICSRSLYKFNLKNSKHTLMILI